MKAVGGAAAALGVGASLYSLYNIQNEKLVKLEMRKIEAAELPNKGTLSTHSTGKPQSVWWKESKHAKRKKQQ